jgi:chromosome segregation ATPase
MMARVETVVVPKPQFDELVAVAGELERSAARVEELENLNHARFHEIQQLLTAIDVAEKNTEDRQAIIDRLRYKLDQVQEERDSFGHRLARANGEVEKLRKMLGMKGTDFLEEVERLQAKIAADKVQNDGLFESEARLLAEVDQLRAACEQHRENAMEMSRVATTREGKEAYEWAAAHIELLARIALEEEA